MNKFEMAMMKSPINYVQIVFTTVSVTDFEISLKGVKLITVVKTPTARDLTVKFNSLIASPIPFSHNDRFELPFVKLYISGRVNNGTLEFYALMDTDFDVQKNNQNEWGGQNAEVVLAGNAAIPSSRLLGIYVQTLGNLVLQMNGANITISNVPAGTFIPISPEAVQNTTTSNIVLIYCE